MDGSAFVRSDQNCTKHRGSRGNSRKKGSRMPYSIPDMAALILASARGCKWLAAGKVDRTEAGLAPLRGCETGIGRTPCRCRLAPSSQPRNKYTTVSTNACDLARDQ